MPEAVRGTVRVTTGAALTVSESGYQIYEQSSLFVICFGQHGLWQLVMWHISYQHSLHAHRWSTYCIWPKTSATVLVAQRECIGSVPSMCSKICCCSSCLFKTNSSIGCCAKKRIKMLNFIEIFSCFEKLFILMLWSILTQIVRIKRKVWSKPLSSSCGLPLFITPRFD